jgi:excisionase family DNA binding protein
MSTPANPNSPLFQPSSTTLKQLGDKGTAPPDQPRELLRVEQAAARLAIGRTSMFALIKANVIESVKVGRLRRVPVDAITAYINHLAATQRPAAA